MMSQAIKRIVRPIVFLAVRALRRRYLGSVGGLLWSLAHPAALVLIYWIVFRHFMRVPMANYFEWLVSGLLPWIFVSSAVLTSLDSLLSRQDVLQTSTVNRLVFILTDTTVELFAFILSLIPFVAFVGGVLGSLHSGTILLLLPCLLPLIVAVYAFCVIFAYLAVRYRDLKHLVQIALTIAFWMTPIVYHWSMVPDQYSILFRWSPITILIAPVQIIFNSDVVPSIALMIAASAIAVLSVVAAVYAYRRYDRDTIYFL